MVNRLEHRREILNSKKNYINWYQDISFDIKWYQVISFDVKWYQVISLIQPDWIHSIRYLEKLKCGENFNFLQIFVYNMNKSLCCHIFYLFQFNEDQNKIIYNKISVLKFYKSLSSKKFFKIYVPTYWYFLLKSNLDSSNILF